MKKNNKTWGNSLCKWKHFYSTISWPTFYNIIIIQTETYIPYSSNEIVFALILIINHIAFGVSSTE